jgi:hypothetical protein
MDPVCRLDRATAVLTDEDDYSDATLAAAAVTLLRARVSGQQSRPTTG